MTKKQKSKFNPFAQILHPDEELLWLYTARLTTLRTYLKRNVLIIFSIIAILSLCHALLHLQDHELSEPMFKFSIFLDGFKFFMFLSLPVQIALYIATWFDYPSSVVAYAVTNQRLLTALMKNVRSTPLEQMQELRLQGDSKICFSEPSTVWRVDEEADEVVSLIVDAREERLNTLGQNHSTHLEERGIFTLSDPNCAHGETGHPDELVTTSSPLKSHVSDE
jgi:hypothetical protein